MVRRLTARLDEASTSIDEEVLPYTPEQREAMAFLARNLHSHACDNEDRIFLKLSLEIQQHLLARTPVDHPEREATLRALAVSLDLWCHMTGDLAALDEAIHHEKEILSSCPPGHQGRAETLDNLGALLRHRNEKMGTVSTSHTKSEHYVAFATEPEIMAELSQIVLLPPLPPLRHESYSESEKLNKQLVSGLCTANAGVVGPTCWDPDRRKAMVSLAQDLYEQSCSENDHTLLNASLQLQEEVLRHTTIEHPERVATLAKLGISLARLYEITENHVALAEALLWKIEALCIYPEDNPGPVDIINNLRSLLRRQIQEPTGFLPLNDALSADPEILVVKSELETVPPENFGT